MLALFVALVIAQPAPQQAECKSAYGKTVCGYHCVAAYGEIRCARTPEGQCKAAYGEVTCWDPEPRDRDGRGDRHRHDERGGRNDGATCESAYGKTACGFDCKAAFGEIKCADTPNGVCHSAYGKLVCWDPPRWVRGHQKARCEAAYGDIACGYGCVSAYGKIKCASSPGGACKAAYGDITCSE